jgi:hypothetical protein
MRNKQTKKNYNVRNCTTNSKTTNKNACSLITQKTHEFIHFRTDRNRNKKTFPENTSFRDIASTDKRKKKQKQLVNIFHELCKVG